MNTQRISRSLLFATGLVGALCSAPSMSQDISHAATAPEAATGASRSAADRHFIAHASAGGRFEVELGNVATAKASNVEVKKFGERMVSDHGKADQELNRISRSLGVSAPTSLDEAQRATIAKLQDMSGGEFDRAYMKEMVQDHKLAVADFKKEAATGRNEQARAFASKTLPTLEKHLTMAENAEQEAKNNP